MNAVKTRWGHLRDYFMKKHREYKATKSGQAAERRKKWHLYELMSFLTPLLEPRETYSNMVNIEIDSMQGSPRALSPGSPGLAPLQTPSPSHTPPPVQTPTPPPSQNSMPPPQRPSTKRKSATSDVDLEILQTLKHENDDDDDMWARSLVPSMKKLDHLDKMEFRVEVQASLLRFLRRKEDTRNSNHNVNIQATEGAMNYNTMENYYQWS